MQGPRTRVDMRPLFEDPLEGPTVVLGTRAQLLTMLNTIQGASRMTDTLNNVMLAGLERTMRMMGFGEHRATVGNLGERGVLTLNVTTIQSKRTIRKGGTRRLAGESGFLAEAGLIIEPQMRGATRVAE